MVERGTALCGSEVAQLTPVIRDRIVRSHGPNGGSGLSAMEREAVDSGHSLAIRGGSLRPQTRHSGYHLGFLEADFRSQ